MDSTSLKWLTAQHWNGEWTREQQPLSMETATNSHDIGRLHTEIESLKAELLLEKQRVVELKAETSHQKAQLAANQQSGHSQAQFKRILDNLTANESQKRIQTEIDLAKLYDSIERKCEESENGLEGYGESQGGTEAQQCLFLLRKQIKEYNQVDNRIEKYLLELRALLARIMESVDERKILLMGFNLPKLTEMVNPTEQSTSTNNRPELLPTYSGNVEMKAMMEGAELPKKHAREYDDDDDDWEAMELAKKPRKDYSNVPELDDTYKDDDYNASYLITPQFSFGI